ncbi:putative permease YjgP/YjgQ family protein [Cyclonatronum proteinivorum]|uniref:Putative permease YjgP/YjgQ family protein n=1 Tax=Cyclonatronum proteinivorum TaxID=1457365 RepID=A0A345UK39_9BACT|nr:LptF/LptG family permease [Cyclonatronum proteinivorum]AXJ00841.1 putative permease YjgP/YjgQ family protein [Cyclonatronum proteinivorum]
MSANGIRKLQREILKRHIGPFLFCFLIVMFLLLMQFLVLHIDRLIGRGLPISIILELIATNLAFMVVLAMPMSVLVACLMAFGKFSELNEFTAARAAGINPLSIIYPILMAGTFLAVFLVYFSNEILPDANFKARSLFLDIRTQRPGFDLQENVFYDGIDGYNFLVRRIPAGTDSLFDVILFRNGNDQVDAAVIRAHSGFLKSVPDTDFLSLFLFDGSISRDLSSGADGKRRHERTFFSTYRVNFDMGDLTFSRSDPNSRRRDDRTMSSQMMLGIIDSLHTNTRNDFELYRNDQSPTRLMRKHREHIRPDAWNPFQESGLRNERDEDYPSSAKETGAAPVQDVSGSNTETIFTFARYADVEAEAEFATADAADSLAQNSGSGELPADTLARSNIEETAFVILNQLQTLELQKDAASAVVASLRGGASRLSSHANNRAWRTERIAQYMVEVHKKVAIPVGCIIFVLVGAPLGILTRKGNLGFNALIATVVFTYYWITIIQGEKLADRLVISPFMGMWFGNITLLALGIYLMAKVMYEFRFSDLWKGTELGSAAPQPETAVIASVTNTDTGSDSDTPAPGDQPRKQEPAP